MPRKKGQKTTKEELKPVTSDEYSQVEHASKETVTTKKRGNKQGKIDQGRIPKETGELACGDKDHALLQSSTNREAQKTREKSYFTRTQSQNVCAIDNLNKPDSSDLLEAATKRTQKFIKKEESDNSDDQDTFYTPRQDIGMQEYTHGTRKPEKKNKMTNEEKVKDDLQGITVQQSFKKQRGKRDAQIISDRSLVVKKTESEIMTRQRVAQAKSNVLHSEETSKVKREETQTKSTLLDVRQQQPNKQATKKNMISSGDAIVKEKIVSLKPLVKEDKIDKELILPQKTAKCGIKGEPIVIETNYLPLILGKLNKAIHYDVAVTPYKKDDSEKSTSIIKMPKKLVQKLMKEFSEQFLSKHNVAFDGTKNLYSLEELSVDKQISGNVTLNEDARSRSFNVIIKFANYIDFAPLWKFMSANIKSNNQRMLCPQEVIQCLDIVLRNAPSLSFLSAGRCFYKPICNELVRLGDGMEMYNGFYQSVVVGSRPYLNVDVVHKAFPVAQNVIDLIMELCGRESVDLQKPLNSYEEDTVNRFIRMLKVVYQIPNTLTKCEYTVKSIERSTINATFMLDNGTQISVQQYFLQEKKINLKYPHMPCLRIEKKNKNIFLPAEFCSIQAGQVINRKMSEKVTSAMIKKTATSTAVRKQKIMDSLNKIKFNEDNCVRKFDISVDEKFLVINARVLEAPELTYNERVPMKPNKGVWKPSKFYSGATLSRWTIINLDGSLRRTYLENLARMLCDHGKSLGMTVEEPRPISTPQLHYRKELEDLKQIFEKRKDLQLIIVVIPKNGQYYSYVKQAAELHVGCLTQCLKSNTVAKLYIPTAINILQKINTKLQGINHRLKDHLECMKVPYMIIGADVTHPSPDAKDKPSIAAVTASFDEEAFKYHLCWRLQPAKVEIIEDLENVMKEHLMYFYKNTNGKKPQRIIFFRDGVSEGQFAAVLNTEVRAIQRACSCLSYSPAITFLVVQKRHHTRFFPINPKDASKDKNFNVPVGTCVDTEIVQPTALDFYLVSHHSVQGVARPTKYSVLWDDAKMSWDNLEELAFKFCHLFSRCTRSVSYPAPTYYAHLAAARIMTYCENAKLNLNNLKKEQQRLHIKDCITEDYPMFFV